MVTVGGNPEARNRFRLDQETRLGICFQVKRTGRRRCLEYMYVTERKTHSFLSSVLSLIRVVLPTRYVCSRFESLA